MVTNFSEKANFIWSIADLIRDTFKRGQYQDVILPLTVLRRIDQVLEPTKARVLETYHEYKDRLATLPDGLLRKASGYAFYNTSTYTFERLLADPANLADNLRQYINSFSPNMREVIEKFNFDNTLSRLDEAGLLYLVMERFKGVDLHPDRVPNEEMGYIFEELIRKFNEALNENPGEHFTPREVIRLMVSLLVSPDRESLSTPHIIRTVADPCCGTGGMLIIDKGAIEEINPRADVHLFGQEVNPETYAVCKSDLYMKSADGATLRTSCSAVRCPATDTLASASTTSWPIRRTARTGRWTETQWSGRPSEVTPGALARVLPASATGNCSSCSICSRE